MDWKTVLGTVAPTAAAILGTPLAGLAVDLIGDALGISEPTKQKVEAALQSGSLTSEQMLALKQADAQIALRAKELDIDLERIAAGDRDSARNREIQTGDVWTPRAIAVLALGGFIWCIYMVLGDRISGLKDPITAGLIGTVIGYASAKADQVVSYYFGSSASSRAKDQIIADRRN